MNIAALLRPYIEDLTQYQLDLVSTYVDLLLRWNARMNLTSIRDPQEVVERHFGESFFLSRKLNETGLLSSHEAPKVLDIGSGAGFPGIPLKIAQPGITLTLVEAQQRKAVFLREVLRALNLDAKVQNVRAEDLAKAEPRSADVVTLRAVEKFGTILPIAGQFVGPKGHLAVLIGANQVDSAQGTLKDWIFAPLFPIPGSESRAILIANKGS